MTLYLKYRPQTFDETVNQNHIKDVLKSQVKKMELMNNYLFFGQRGTGKTTLARILARAVNCQGPVDGSPCNKCVNCLAMLSGKTLDFVEIDAASHTQVDNIREEIIEKAPYPPSMLKKKVYIIDEVHMLSKFAFNALLKIMEEPPEYLVFILATTEVNKVPETIVSRSLVFNFKKLSIDDIVTRIEFIAKEENYKYNPQALQLIAKVSDGAMRDAIKYLEQVSIIGEVNEENVSMFLGVAPDKLISEFMDLLKSANVESLFGFFDGLQQGGIDLYTFIKQVLIDIDEKFLEDIKFYSQISELLRNVLVNIKNYPLPIVIVKTEIVKYIINNGGDLKKKSLKISSNESENNLVPQPAKIEAATPVVENVEQKLQEEIQNIPKQDLVESSESITAEQNVQQDIVLENNPKEEEKIIEQDQTEKTDVDQKVSENKGSESWIQDELIDKVAGICEKKLLVSALKRYSKIESIQDDVVNITVINKMQYTIMNNQDNLSYLTKLFIQVIGKDVSLILKYISKEEFFENSMN